MPKHKFFFILLLIVSLPSSYLLGYTPILLSLTFFMFSLLAYLAYAKDKLAAQKGTWRVPEKTLHLLSLFFGWPGAMIAQERLRHKTKKVSFRIVFWLTLFLNIAVICIFHTPNGSKIVKYSVSIFDQFVITKVRSEQTREMLLLLTKIEKY